MHILLCGLPQVGKSTIIKKVLKDFKITPSGFITLASKRQANGYSSIYIHSANSLDLEENDANRVGLRMGYGKFKMYPEVFETIGLNILKKVAPPLILMDELGFMENGALNYQARIIELLEQDIPILGVIKPRDKETPFLRAVREHSKTAIIDVNKDNRDKAYHQVKLLFQEQHTFVT